MKNVIAVTLAIMVLCTGADPAFAGWTVVNLNPAGATTSYATGVSNGQQVGFVEGSARAGLWTGSAASWIDLTPAGATYSYAYDVSGDQQVGTAKFSGVGDHASLWRGSAASWVDLNPAGMTQSCAVGVSGSQQAGYAIVSGYNHAGLWSGTAASWIDLHPAGATHSAAAGVSGGQQAGYATFDDKYHAGLWSGTAASWVDLHPAGARYSVANGISDGHQVGFADFGENENFHAGLWSGTAASWVDLNPAGSQDSRIYGISGGHQVGSASFDDDRHHAGIWSGTAASWVDLHALLPAGLYTDSYASDVNVYANEIWVSGFAVSDRVTAMLWRYTTEPVAAPPAPTITDDGATTTTPTQLHATWTSADPESGIVEYQYAIGTTPTDPGSGYVVGWTSTGTTARTTQTGLSLAIGPTYYFYVKAKNGAGLWSAVGVSDGIQYVPESTTVAAAKQLADNQSVTLVAKAVTYASANFFYVEDQDRNMGIRVESVAHGLTVGMRANFEGALKTNTSRERYIQASAAVHNGEGTVTPLGVNNVTLGGQDWMVSGTKGQRGTTGSIGLTNIGLLVRTWGGYRQVDATTFTIDDGSGPVLCRIASGTVLSSAWQKVTVTGISSVYKYNSVTYLPMVLVRDIHVLLPDTQSDTEMVYIPAGSFLIGNNGIGNDAVYGYSSEFPQHSVYLSAYSIGKYEVTRGEYRAFMTATGRTAPVCWDAVQDWGTGSFTQTENHPVVGVTWYDAEAYCAWAGGRLPTEVEWEKASRWTGSSPNVYPWGNIWDVEKCNNYYDTNSAGGGNQRLQTAPAGSYPSGASPYGCQDMAGNVLEWVGDWYKSYPGSSSPFDDTNIYRVLRGGSWSTLNGDYYARAAYRYGSYPSYYDLYYFGFRLAR